MLGFGFQKRRMQAPTLPASLGTPVFRFRPDASLVTLSSGKITACTALNGNNISSVGTTNPTYTVNNSLYGGRPSVTFNNSQSPQGLTASFTVSQPNTAVIVGSASNSGCAIIDGSSGYRQQLSRNSSFWQMYAGTAVITSTKAADANPHVFACIYNGASSALYVDSSLTNYLSGNPGTSGLSADIQIGCSSRGGSQTITGDIAEVIIFSGALTAAQLAVLFAQYAAPYYCLVAS